MKASPVCHHVRHFIKQNLLIDLIYCIHSCFKVAPYYCRPKFGGKPCQGSKERFRVMLPTDNGKCEPYSFTGLVSQFSLHKKSFSLRISSVNLTKSAVIWSLKKKLYGSFLRMGFNCLVSTEPLRGGSLLFTPKFLEISGTHLIDLGRMKG